MSDPRVERAQSLLWQIEALRRLGQPQAAVAPRLVEMAQLHEERARELLSRRETDGWVDLFAAVTAWGEAGRERAARELLRFGRELASRWPAGDALLSELAELERWLEASSVLPALEDFARPIPRFEVAA